jgi:hypothetical protein
MATRDYHRERAERILVGTAGGLWTLQGDSTVADETLAGRPVTALAREGTTLWAVVHGTTLWERREGAWTQRAAIAGPPATCVVPTAAGVPGVAVNTKNPSDPSALSDVSATPDERMTSSPPRVAASAGWYKSLVSM